MTAILFGILITVISYAIGDYIYRQTGIILFNPIVISMAIILTCLNSLNISYEYYNEGAKYISLFLYPATVVLAVPLYEQIHLLKENALAILSGIIIGSLSGMVAIILGGRWLQLSDQLIISLVPKSISTPIGIELSSSLGGSVEITTMSIVITGVLGALINATVCRIARITDPVAAGTAIGTSAHAMGTSKALELGMTQGAMSSLSIGVAGLFTAFMAPILVKILL